MRTPVDIFRKIAAVAIATAVAACSSHSPSVVLQQTAAVSSQSMAKAGSKIDPSGIVFDLDNNVYFVPSNYRVLTDSPQLDEQLLGIDFANPQQDIFLWENHYRLSPYFAQSPDTGDGTALLFYSIVDVYGNVVRLITRYIERRADGRICIGVVTSTGSLLEIFPEIDCVYPSPVPSPSPEASPAASPSPVASPFPIPSPSPIPTLEPSPEPSPKPSASVAPSPLPSVGSLPTGARERAIAAIEARLGRPPLTPAQHDALVTALDRLLGRRASPTPAPTAEPTKQPNPNPSPSHAPPRHSPEPSKPNQPGDLESLNPYELTITHLRTMSKTAFDKFVEELRRDGYMKESIKYVDFMGKKYVVDGHHRLEAAKILGWKQVPAQRVTLPYKGYRTPDDFFNIWD